MLELSSRKLQQIAVHKVGNQFQEEGFHLSETPLLIDDLAVQELLLKYFLNPFKSVSQHYHFDQEEGVVDNPMVAMIEKMFEEPDSFMEQSKFLAEHLYSVSIHPKINGGEFYVTYLTDILLDDQIVDAIGLFKSETKETFLKVFPSSDSYDINYDEGVSINKLDKGCLIFNVEKEKGYRVCTVDNLNRQEALYWKDDFLKVKPREDSFYHTENYIKMCKDFVDEKLKTEFEVSKMDELNLMNRSVDYFKKNDTFDLNTFSKDVIQQPEIIDAFRDYKQQYADERQVQVYDEFDISQPAVKQGKKVYKSIIKLDKNFHIYVHGNRDWIERGKDEATGLNYYKCFYKEES